MARDISHVEDFSILENSKKSRNNILGWYLYSFSSEPFTVSAVSTYIPLLLERFARLNGVNLNDHSMKCLPVDDKCVIGLFNDYIYIDTSSFALYTFSLSVFFQTLLVISVSGLVDINKSVRLKKNIILFFGILGAISTLVISRLNSSQFYLLGICVVIANCCYGVVNVVGNSLLPGFAFDICKYNAGYVDNDVDKLTTLISGRGSGLGYISALFVQVFSMVLVKKSDSQDNIQLAIFLVGIWWLILQIPIYWLITDLIIFNDYTNHQESRYCNLTKYLKVGWLSFVEALKHSYLLKDVVIFLIGWFILSDSVSTINSTAVLFAKTELKMNTLDLILISILTMINAIIGAFFIPQFLSNNMGLTSQKMLIFIICWSSMIPFYGILGFMINSIGLKHSFEMYILAVWYGISLGGLSAVSRSVFSLIIPKGQESIFFSLFNVTDKGSSIVGPVLIALLTDKTHNIRYAFYLLFLLLIISLPIFNSLDISRGKQEAQELGELENNILQRTDYI